LPHRAIVVAVAAAILVVFFVPLPHVSLFKNLVAQAKVTPGSHGTGSSLRVTATAVTGAGGDLWLLGTYSCSRGTCPVVMRSTNGGKSFVRVGTPPHSVDSLVFANREDGYAIFPGSSLERPVLYWTRDGGMTWRLAQPGGAHVWQGSSLAGPPASSVVTTNGRTYVLFDPDCPTSYCKFVDLASSAVTRDDWRTTRVPVDTANYQVYMAAFGAKIWLIMTSDPGGSARVLVSSDGGRSFANLPSTGMEGLACSDTATSAKTLWGFCATGSLGYPVRSTDGGGHFAPIAGWSEGHKGEAANAGSLLPLSDNAAVFQPSQGAFWLTTDGGRNFNPVRFSSLWQSPNYDYHIAFASRTTWLVLGVEEPSEKNLMWRTTSGGRSWQPVKVPTVKQATAVPCKASQLAVAFFGSGVGNPGQAVTAIGVTDVSSTACSLVGYPSLTFLGNAGGVVRVTVGHASDFFGVLATVTLSPKKTDSAGFLVSGSDSPAAGNSCPTAASIRVGLPDVGPSFTVVTNMRLCRLHEFVSPIVRGAKLAPLL